MLLRASRSTPSLEPVVAASSSWSGRFVLRPRRAPPPEPRSYHLRHAPHDQFPSMNLTLTGSAESSRVSALTTPCKADDDRARTQWNGETPGDDRKGSRSQNRLVGAWSQAVVLSLAAGLASGTAGWPATSPRFPASARGRRRERRSASSAAPIDVPPLTPKLDSGESLRPDRDRQQSGHHPQQLADECVARKGKKILDLLINRTSDRAGPPGQEDGNHGGRHRPGNRAASPHDSGSVANSGSARSTRSAGSARFSTPATSSTRRSPCAGCAAGRVQVTPEDLQESVRGPVRRQASLPDDLGRQASDGHRDLGRASQEPGSVREDRPGRVDGPATASLGGLLAQPITRHAIPENLSDAAFHQFVDGDSRDKDPSHKPKDGDFTGPIQVGELGWVHPPPRVARARRPEGRPQKRKRPQANVRIDVRRQAQGSDGLRLPGAHQGRGDREPVDRHVKLANEEKDPTYATATDQGVKLMSGQGPARKGDLRKNGPASAGCPSAAAPCQDCPAGRSLSRSRASSSRSSSAPSSRAEPATPVPRPRRQAPSASPN